MCSPNSWGVFLVLILLAPGPLAFAQSVGPADGSTPSESTTKSAAEDEVRELRREVTALQAQIQRLTQASERTQPAEAHLVPATDVAASAAGTDDASGSGGVTRADIDTLQREIDALKSNAGAANAGNANASNADVSALQKQVDALQKKANEVPPVTAGWNGEHFFLRSTDGNFTLMPVGYVDGQYAIYDNSYGAPPDSFSITRARFGFQGNYGKQLDYVFMVETISSPTIRDAYMDFKPWSFFNILGGQFKVPFSLEVGTADTAVDFYNRSIISTLYPDAGGAFRAPGLDFHGQLASNSVEYWIGLFNGQGLLTSGTTNEPEVVGRLRVSPFKLTQIPWLQELAVGGSFEHSRSKGLANEMSFSGAMNDGTYTFFPQFRINGNVNRYNAFLSWLSGPLGVRAEYAHLVEDRTDIGSLATGGIGFNSQPAVTGEGFYVSAIYFLTGETDPLNALPRVRHPVIGPASPGESGAPGWGAWAVKFRYSRLQGDAPGSSCDASTIPACPITPVTAPGFIDRTDQFTFGVNWYLNYWVLVKSEVNLDRLQEPSVQGILPHNYYVFLETLQFRF
jgi:phosphate-selective porin